MSSAAQVLRQADALKASISESTKAVSETWVVRQRLEDLYKKLLLMDLEYALDKKVEQDLWNFAFKNHINTLQSQTKDRQNVKRGESHATLNLFLETASGFYLQLIQLVCTTFKLDLSFRRKSACFGIMKEKTTLRVKIVPPKKSSCLYVCQYCLVHLGDIARYRQQIEQAQTYYWHAANLVPFNGQPYNQLAIVEAARGNKLTTVFYYIRSLAVRHPFPAAATNLEKLYTKLIKDIPEYKGKLSVSEMITAFLQLHACIHLCTELDRANTLSTKLLNALPAHVTSQSFPSHILVQIVAINIFSMHHAHRQDNDGDEEIHEELSGDELKSFTLMFSFTIGILDILLQNTPKQEQKLREFFTLPAIKLMLEWFKLNPTHLKNSILKSSSVWGNLSKVLNTIKQPNKEGTPDISKYEDLPLPEDTELRCFQFLEKAHSSYSYSRLPAEGLATEVESQLRCHRIYLYGKWLAEDCTSFNLLTAQTTKSGKLQFNAPVVRGNTDDVPVPNTEKKSTRQNVAIQAIIQKKNQQASEKNTITPTKIQERVKPAPATLESTVKVLPTAVQGPHSPKYLLGVPTSEPVFMKSGASNQTNGTRPASQGANRVQQQPPRLQKLAQQQGSSQPTLWQENNSTPQILTKQSSSGHITPQQQKLLWPHSLKQKKEMETSETANENRLQTGQQTESSPPVQAPQQVQQRSAEVQRSQPQPESRQQAQHPFMSMPHDFRVTSRFPNTSQPPPQGVQNPGLNFNTGPIRGSQGPTAMPNNNSGNALFRFPPPPISGNNKQFPMMPFDIPPPPLPQQLTRVNSSEGTDRGNNSGLLFPGMMPSNQSKPEVSQHNSNEPNFPRNQQAINPQGPSISSISANTNNSMANQQSPSSNQYPPNVPGNRNLFHNANPMNFQPAPGNERPHFGGTKPQQTLPPHLQNAPFQNHLLSQLLAMSPAMGRMNLRPQGMQGSNDQPVKKEDFPFVPPELLGALSQLAVQPPPNISQENFLMQSRMGTTFQGHAEGTPKPDAGNSPNRSPLPVSEPEPRIPRSSTHQGQTTQQGTYSLFSSSPWSVPLSAADTKNMTPSPFSSESGSIRNSPDSGTENTEAKMAQGFDLGLRFGSNEDLWREKAQGPNPTPEQVAASGPGPYFPGPLQSIWSSPGPSPLEKLLEMQKQQRQTDPH